MRKSFAGALALTITTIGLTGFASSATAVAPTAVRTPVVKLWVDGTQAKTSQRTMRPGVVEFRAGKSFTIPGPEGGPDALAIVRTDDLDKLKSLLQTVFGGDPSDPNAGAVAAQAMAEIQSIARFYGGMKPGGVWQVALPKGAYAVVAVQSFVMGMTKPMTFTVAGDRRPGRLHETTATMAAVAIPGGNAFESSGTKRMGDGWLRFDNRAKEIHFLDLSGVKPGTTDAMIKAAFQSPDEPDFFNGKSVFMEVVSPKVSVAIKGPIPKGKWLATCFVPSTTDGMPHSLMGMWKLVVVG